MLLLLRKADEVLNLYKEISALELDKKHLEVALNRRSDRLKVLEGTIATLEIENETLLREVEHWKAESQAARKKITNG